MVFVKPAALHVVAPRGATLPNNAFFIVCGLLARISIGFSITSLGKERSDRRSL